MNLLDMTLSDIERLLRSLQSARPDDPELIKQIISRVQPSPELPHARTTIGSLFTLLNQTGGSTALPDDIVQILKTETETQASPVCVPVVKVKKYAPTPEELETVGTRVRIRRDSEFSHQESGEGTVTKAFADSDNYWCRGLVIVKWDSGNDSRVYRTGRINKKEELCRKGLCDLELASSPTVAVVGIATAPGKIKSFEVLIPADHPRQPVEPGDIVQIDLITRQVINT